MKFEHLGYNVADPAAMAEWYVKNMGLTIVKKGDSPARAHFLADDAGAMLEIYNNPPDRVPDYANQDPLLLHIAWVSENPAADRDRLVAAGATLVEDFTLADGSHIVMLRDPWGVAIQLCKRGTPFAAVR